MREISPNPNPNPSPNSSPNPSQVLECHLTAPFRLARAAADHMRALYLPLSPFISLNLVDGSAVDTISACPSIPSFLPP